ncbi:uncharacterized protein YbjT (DUF2867 family) [Mycolicibacterium iranicum]|uniref:Uncharacterized protein YbjT (DUF2867 family) n=1 Tax=Mycolicibacterium iranicum TaxID=912594 RepID=A0A839Q2C2_MYCIR|nr:SDR family oxidoreductase [Mycolicibacterium iranicum]MBB2989074.1 uncharacterized protein YbjT (DUF2867 family) [Mycolicibacterium iranicum]
MKITVFGATGQIGAQVVDVLTAAGHDVIAASRTEGVDAVSGEGVRAAVDGADVVVDVLNSPTMEPVAAVEFFRTSATNLVAASREAQVDHYVVLSIVGVGGVEAEGYLQGKHLQEELVATSGVPYTIVRATQFHEFADGIVRSLIVDHEVRAPDALIQPVAAAEVAAVVARTATGSPRNGVLSFGGPEKMSFAEMAEIICADEDLTVRVDPEATYFGVALGHGSLVTGDDGELGATRLSEWLAQR